MKLYAYKTNVFNYDRYTNTTKGLGVSLIAKNKKDALKFIKDFKGMTLGERLKRQEYAYDFDVMGKQKELLTKGLQHQTLVIVGE